MINIFITQNNRMKKVHPSAGLEPVTFSLLQAIVRVFYRLSWQGHISITRVPYNLFKYISNFAYRIEFEIEQIGNTSNYWLFKLGNLICQLSYFMSFCTLVLSFSIKRKVFFLFRLLATFETALAQRRKLPLIEEINQCIV